MDLGQKQLGLLFEVFARSDSTFRQIENERQALDWHPSLGREETAFKALIAIENRKALKEWFASMPTLNPHAERFRRVLENVTQDQLPVGLHLDP